jgi:hypothetical protein
MQEADAAAELVLETLKSREQVLVSDTRAHFHQRLTLLMFS